MAYKRSTKANRVRANFAGIIIWQCPKCEHMNRCRKSWTQWVIKCRGCTQRYMIGLVFHEISRGARGPHVPDDAVLPTARSADGVWRRYDDVNMIIPPTNDSSGDALTL